MVKLLLIIINSTLFSCRFCRQKGWTQPIIILATPQGLNQKDTVVMATYPSANLKASKVLNWVNTRLAKTVHTINEGRLIKEWLKASQSKPSMPSIKLVLMSEKEDSEAPLFFSAISLKYSGRVKFRQAFIRDSAHKLLSEKFKIESKSSRYLVGTPEGMIMYGTHDGEYLNHRAMDVYLRTLYPQANDFFMLSFVIGNMLCVLELAVNGDHVLAKRVCYLLWVWAKYNAILIMLWLPLLALTQLPFLDPAFQFCHKVLRLLSQTVFASQLRSMWIIHSYHGGLIIASFFVFCAVIGYAQSRFGSNDNGNEEETSSSEWLQSTVGYYYNMLVRPSPGYTPVLLNNAHIEAGVPWNHINPLGFPNLFLLADRSQDYLKDLPTWRYHHREIKEKLSMGNFMTSCSSWQTCFPDDRDERHKESCRLLREYFRERDKKLNEYKVGGKYTKRGKKHLCKKCLVRFVDDPKRGEPFLVTETRELSDSCQKGAIKTCSNFPLPPENLGSASVDNTYLENDLSSQNLQSGPIEKSSYTGNKCDNELVKTPQHDNDHRVTLADKPTCDCRLFDLGCGLKSTFDPWPEGMMESLECSICLEPYVEGVTLCGLPCGHAFHQRCITLWLTTNQNHCCPNCRWPAYKTKGAKLSKHKE